MSVQIWRLAAYFGYVRFALHNDYEHLTEFLYV